MTTIDVIADETGRRLTVTIEDEDGTSSRHVVGVSDADWDRFGGGYGSRFDLMLATFRFLLEREPKESILGSFELRDIARYFPEYGERFTERGSA